MTIRDLMNRVRASAMRDAASLRDWVPEAAPEAPMCSDEWADRIAAATAIEIQCRANIAAREAEWKRLGLVARDY